MIFEKPPVMTFLKITRRDALLTGVSAALVPTAFAESTPTAASKVVKLIVGFPSGQATDLVSRVLVDSLRAVTGDSYVIDNRPGAGGSIALGQLAKSPANGTVMMLAHMSATSTTPHTYLKVPYDRSRNSSLPLHIFNVFAKSRAAVASATLCGRAIRPSAKSSSGRFA